MQLLRLAQCPSQQFFLGCEQSVIACLDNVGGSNCRGQSPVGKIHFRLQVLPGSFLCQTLLIDIWYEQTFFRRREQPRILGNKALGDILIIGQRTRTLSLKPGSDHVKSLCIGFWVGHDIFLNGDLKRLGLSISECECRYFGQTDAFQSFGRCHLKDLSSQSTFNPVVSKERGQIGGSSAFTADLTQTNWFLFVKRNQELLLTKLFLGPKTAIGK